MRTSKAKALKQLSKDRKHYQALKKAYRGLTKAQKEQVRFTSRLPIYEMKGNS